MGAKRPDMFDVAAGDCQLMDFLLTRFDPLDLKTKVRVDPQGNMTELSSGPGGVKESAPVKVADVMLGARIPEPAGEAPLASPPEVPPPAAAAPEAFVPIQPVAPSTAPPASRSSADSVQLGTTELAPAASTWTATSPPATPLAGAPDSATLSGPPPSPAAAEAPSPAGAPDLLDLIQNFHAERLRYLEEESKRDNPA